MTLNTAVILAGGENSRFFPLNTDTHKGGLILCGKSIVVNTLENLFLVGISRVCITVSKKDFAGRGLSAEVAKIKIKSGCSVDFILQEKAEGMGEALLLVKEKIK